MRWLGQYDAGLAATRTVIEATPLVICDLKPLAMLSVRFGTRKLVFIAVTVQSAGWLGTRNLAIRFPRL